MNPETVRDWRDYTAALATEAGARAAHEWTLGQAEVVFKTDGSIVTSVDRHTEEFLRQQLQKRFPGHAILGEEYGGEAQTDAEFLWAIDPVDGTTNLAHGLPYWGVSIGLLAHGQPLVGAFAAPQLGETFAAGHGVGALLNDQPLAKLAAGGSLGWEDAIAVCSTSVRTLDFSQIAVRLRIFGAAGLDLCWAAAGRLEGCQSIGTKIWDVAAGVLIASECGATTQWLSARQFDAASMAADGPREDDVLLTAPPETLDYLQQRLRWR